ncbi:hypothetical protein RRG08_027062 [Elysia crispata]|uniref:Uncharacterized protein n=1 Tax=Elysia crispata TaxID=231223 RepID=A0AAE0ZHD9_9GAST|nr:hypothetical protein RRG08_027062 [Elysia crispata]
MQTSTRCHSVYDGCRLFPVIRWPDGTTAVLLVTVSSTSGEGQARSAVGASLVSGRNAGRPGMLRGEGANVEALFSLAERSPVDQLVPHS